MAIRDFTRVIELDPAHSDAYHNRALANKSLGNEQQYATDLAKANELLESARKSKDSH
jgi:hypothetical protein